MPPTTKANSTAPHKHTLDCPRVCKLPTDAPCPRCNGTRVVPVPLRMHTSRRGLANIRHGRYAKPADGPRIGTATVPCPDCGGAS